MFNCVFFSLIIRHTTDTIEQLGCTDLRQQWGQIKQKVSDAYAAEPLHKFCHGLQSETEFEKPSELKKQILKTLCEADIESELSQHTRCYRSARGTHENLTAPRLSKNVLKTLNNNNDGRSKTVPAKPTAICDLNAIYGFKLNSDICNEFSKFLSNNIWETCLNNFNLRMSCQQDAMFYNKFVSITVERAKNILFTTIKQNSDVWYQERSRRITGSICYSLYTYMKRQHSKDEWIKKINSTFNSSFKGNSDTFRGKICEDKAKVVYEKSTGHKVQELGLLILNTSPWLGYSSDGIANKNILLEIKSPKNDKNLDVQELLKTLPYIQFQENKPLLKNHHPYYGQVQLGLCLLALEKCHFVVYDSIHDTTAIVDVPRNDEFIKDLVLTISKCYFEHVLPWLSARGTPCNKEN